MMDEYRRKLHHDKGVTPEAEISGKTLKILT